MKKLMLLVAVAMLAGCGSGSDGVSAETAVETSRTYTITVPRPRATSEVETEAALLRNLGAVDVTAYPITKKVVATCTDATINTYVDQGSWHTITDGADINLLYYQVL